MGFDSPQQMLWTKTYRINNGGFSSQYEMCRRHRLADRSLKDQTQKKAALQLSQKMNPQMFIVSSANQPETVKVVADILPAAGSALT